MNIKINFIKTFPLLLCLIPLVLDLDIRFFQKMLKSIITSSTKELTDYYYDEILTNL